MEPREKSSSPEQSSSDRFNHWIRNSATVRLFSILVLVLLLLIPMGMIRQLISEREDTRNEAIEEVRSKFASEQLVFGPYISVPYIQNLLDSKGIQYQETRYLNISPELLNIHSLVDPLIKKRGIFKVVLYKSIIDFDGKFKIDKTSIKGIAPSAIQWENAFVAVKIADTRAIDNQMSLKFNGSDIAFKPGIPCMSSMGRGVHAPIDLSGDSLKDAEFSFNLNLDGSSELMFAPIGKTTNASMKSSWTSPSFDGAFVTDSNTVSKDGFEAYWSILEFNKNIPDYWSDEAVEAMESAFGVKLLMPVDFYQKSMRTAKYAILVIVLTFTIFFLVEVLNRKRIHPVQYVLVGLAITLFYSMLLALSEFLGFEWAYLVSTVGIVGMVGFYTNSIFHSRKLTLIASVILLSLYAFIYVILQLNDMALILGNVGLFIALAVVMYSTRKLDWYNMKREQ